MKRFLILILCFLVFLVSAPCHDRECPFCSIEILKLQALEENSSAIALYTHRPITKGHSLIIPKRHVEKFHELTQNELFDIQKLINQIHQVSESKLEVGSYLLLQKNGKEVGQSVDHLHFHYIPRHKKEKSVLKLAFEMVLNLFLSPLDKKEILTFVENYKSLANEQKERIK
jgi:diadenosine tetraphosphate (Ap4A) HIT family hydrolase